MTLSPHTQLRHVSACPTPAALRAQLLVLPPEERNGLMKSRLRQWSGSPLRSPAMHLAASAGGCALRVLFLGGGKDPGLAGSDPHFEGRSRPTVLRSCFLARSMTSCRSCRRPCEGPNEQSPNPQKGELPCLSSNHQHQNPKESTCKFESKSRLSNSSNCTPNLSAPTENRL